MFKVIKYIFVGFFLLVLAMCFHTSFAPKYNSVKNEITNYEHIDKVGFANHKNEIYAEIDNHLSQENYKMALVIINKWISVNDAIINEYFLKAKKLEKIKETKILLNELKTIPIEKFHENQIRYEKLVAMHPENQVYKGKLRFYDDKIKEQAQIKSQFSGWNGAHINLQRLIKSNMKNPDSYEHVDTIYWNKGDYLIVQTTFRGTNSFNAVVPNTIKAKVSLSGDVLEIINY